MELMEKPFVLIVEDERDIAALFRHVLDLAGFRTETASNGRLALDRLAECLPDAVLLDLSLPAVPGVEVLRSIRADARLKGTPVVVVTAYSEMAESLAVEPDLVMLKPVSSAQLTGLVQRLTGKGKKPAAPFKDSPWDEVTGLYNRGFFEHRLDSALRGLKENPQELFGVLVLSPGRYEEISRQHGSRKADEFVHALALAVRSHMRPTDTLARFESDHFFILIERSPGLHIPEMIAARIQQSLGNEADDGEPGNSVACDVGVLLCDTRYTTVDEILRDANAAYTLAQAVGPGACLSFDHGSITAKARGKS